MKKYFLFLLFIASNAFAQYTVSGYITDSLTGETLIGATLYESHVKKGTVSNTYGHYSITLPKGVVNLTYSYVGYEKKSISFRLQKDTVINRSLPITGQLNEVTVLGNKSEIGVRGTQMSTIDVPIAQIKTLPALMGEVDVIKALQLLPGVQGGTEGSAGMYVRGGGPDENLMLLDGVPVYNVNHLFGFFSVFNADAIKSVTLYKGNFPARFGSRLSSVIDIRMNDGNNKQVKGSVNVGLISSKFNLEGPLFNEKTTFNISARRTYFDILAKPFIRLFNAAGGLGGESDFGYYFYDVNAKITHKISDKHRLFLSLYNGEDHINFGLASATQLNENSNIGFNWGWGNSIASLKWNYLITNKLFCNTSLTYTNYVSNIDIAIKNTQLVDAVPISVKYGMGYNSGIYDWSFRTDFDYAPNPDHDIKFGTNYIYHTFIPDVTSFDASLIDTTIRMDMGDSRIYPHELVFFAEDNINFGSRVKANVGLHFSNFFVQGEHYWSLQPRASVRVMLTDKLSVKAAYSEMTQYIHLLSSSLASLPTDLWVPVTKKIKPMTAQQVSLGAFYELPYGIDFSLEGYYKYMNNLIEYKEGASMFMSSDSEFGSASGGWEDKVAIGQGWAYGMEVLLQKSVGKTTGWIGYTLSWAERQFDEISFGKVFPAKYDRRHDLSITLSHKLNDNIDFGVTWVFGTGTAATLGTQVFNSPIFVDGLTNVFQQYNYYESRNNYRLPNSHRLDIGINFHKKKAYGIRTWNISVYNVYNQKNPFLIFPSYQNGSQVLKQYSLFPIIPSVSYTYKF